METKEIENDINTNENDINQDILYEPNDFHVPNITNKTKIQQSATNILAKDSQKQKDCSKITTWKMKYKTIYRLITT